MSLTPGTNDLYRIGTDLLGSRQVPAYAYYGIHTLRAVENFQISGVPITNDVYPTAIKLALHFMAQHMLESAATCGCFPPGRAPGWGKSTCRRCRRVPASCPGRSNR